MCIVTDPHNLREYLTIPSHTHIDTSQPLLKKTHTLCLWSEPLQASIFINLLLSDPPTPSLSLSRLKNEHSSQSLPEPQLYTMNVITVVSHYTITQLTEDAYKYKERIKPGQLVSTVRCKLKMSNLHCKNVTALLYNSYLFQNEEKDFKNITHSLFHKVCSIKNIPMLWCVSVTDLQKKRSRYFVK